MQPAARGPRPTREVHLGHMFQNRQHGDRVERLDAAQVLGESSGQESNATKVRLSGQMRVQSQALSNPLAQVFEHLAFVTPHVQQSAMLRHKRRGLGHSTSLKPTV